MHGFDKGALVVDDATTSRANLGLIIGTDVQAYSSILSSVAAGTYTGSTSITTLGTIVTGVWNGTAIANANLANSQITINGIAVSLGGSTTITAATTAALTVGNGLQFSSGTTFDGSVAKTISANFNATNLKITSSALNTIQDIATSSSPTFAALNSDYLSSKTANTALQIGSGFGSTDTGSLTLYTNGTGNITLQNGANTTANAIELTPLAGGITLQPALNKDITLTTSGTGVTSVSKLNLPNLTASYALVTDSSKNVAAIPYTTASTPLTIMQRSVTGSTSAQQVVLGADPSAAMEAATKQYVDGASTSGNAATATKLQTARAINGVNFDGSAAITVPAAAGTLTGTTLASGVTASSLTSVSTLLGLTVSSAGITLQNGTSLYSPATLDYYENKQTSTVTTSGAVAASMTATFSRIGNRVVMTIPDFTWATSGAAALTAPALVPARFRPSSTLNFICRTLNANTTWSASVMQILSSGNVVFYANIAANGFTAGTSTYTVYGMPWSWDIN